MTWRAHLRFLLRGDAQAERIVPRTGLTAWLTLFAAGAMGFLGVFALVLSLSAARLADAWGGTLAQTATVRITAPPEEPEEMEARTQAVLRILETTAGVAYARALDDAEQRALLAPWFGDALDLSALPVPRLVEVLEEDAGLDATGLRLRLEAEVPGAVFDDHGRWRAPLVAAANRLWALGLFALVLLLGSVAAIVTLAAQASLAANAQLIEVLRLVGATDSYIAQAFVRRFTLRSAGGAALGALLGFLLLLVLPRSGAVEMFLPEISLGALDAFWGLLIPFVAAATAFFATGAAARRTLQGLR